MAAIRNSAQSVLTYRKQNTFRLDAEVKPNCFIVRDGNGQTLSYIYYESESVRRSAVKLLGKDEVRRIAARIASCRSAGAGAPGFNHKVRSCGSERLMGGQALC